MLEFTMSRVAVCICGILLLAASVAAVGAVQDGWRDRMDAGIAEDVASALDAFEASGVDAIVLVGSDVLPSPEYHITVSGNVVELTSPNGIHRMHTEYPGSFTLSYGGEAEVESVPKTSAMCLTVETRASISDAEL